MIGTHFLPCLFAAVMLALPARAQSFPTKPVRIVVPFGGVAGLI